jgi:hypothetical protein
MKDVIKYSDLKRIHPYSAVGKVCIDLLDPVTGKVKKRVNGKNMVFPDSLYSGSNGNWIGSVSQAYLVLNDDDTPINLNMPYALGKTIGYGIPSQPGLGLYRGAYNEANQVLASITPDGVRWKFQYDFTGAQAIGTIKNIALTHQYKQQEKLTSDRFYVVNPLNTYDYTSDGRYSYMCSTAGIITKYDNLSGTSSTINISAVVGTSVDERKVVGYAPATGLYYVYVYSATPANTKMYVFTDATFATNSASYSMSNCTYNPSYYAMYVYGDVAFFPAVTFKKVDFVNNQPETTQAAISTHVLVDSLEYKHRHTLGYDKYIFKLGAYSESCGWIYDMSLQEVVGYFTRADNTASSEKHAAIRHPITTNFMPVIGFEYFYNNCAIAAKVLDEPVTKPDNLGMRATYELEVFWDL